MRRVVVTGLGVLSPIGNTVAEFFDALVHSRSGIRRLPDDLQAAGSDLVAGLVSFDAAAHWPPHQSAQFDRATQFALVAARQALSDAAFSPSGEEAFSTGVYWGTGLGGAHAIEDSYRQLFAGSGRVRPTAVVLGMNNAAAGQVSIANGLRGPIVNFSTACSSSATSIGEAFRAIRDGYAEAIVAGGSEALVTAGNLRAWDAMQALAHADSRDASRSCKPFSANRTGIVLGEGAGAVMLESEESARRRNARILAEVVGYGNAADARGISKPDASGQARAMRAALADARVDATEIGYVNAHGTATPIGDVVETTAIKEAFGCASATLALSSTKALHGHLMGATGAVEFIAALCALDRGVIPPTAHLERPDPACDLDYVANEARARSLDVVMSNSFGFGGMNAVLIARRYDA
ncbi:MAG TPA: beta-ketoacyl-[acyl-carrier-protein] synthase family protein [Gemmatimonadaceae bacterium]